jgi:glyoxylase-like metal-dependent hydrolase (beta-lactamase superfamily II)
MTTKFSIGAIRVDRIIEGEYPFSHAQEFLPTLDDATLAANRGWMRAAGALDERDWLVLCIQSYVLRTPHHTILVDSCVGNHKPRPTRPIWNMKTDDTWMRALAAAGLTVEDIDLVMCTHLHVDHVGWNTRLENGRWVPTFPKARYLFAAKEYAYWEAENAKAPVLPFTDSVLPIVEAGRHELVSSAHALDDHIRLMPTPGHTPDHFAVVVGKGRDEAVITGDLIHTPLQARIPELSMRADVDPAQSAATRRGFLERYCDTATVCCTAHFPSPSRVRVKRAGSGFNCETVTG